MHNVVKVNFTLGLLKLSYNIKPSWCFRGKKRENKN